MRCGGLRSGFSWQNVSISKAKMLEKHWHREEAVGTEDRGCF